MTTTTETITYTRKREQRVERICEQCHKRYVGIARSHYCSKACNQSAVYYRHQPARIERQRRYRAENKNAPGR